MAIPRIIVIFFAALLLTSSHLISVDSRADLKFQFCQVTPEISAGYLEIYGLDTVATPTVDQTIEYYRLPIGTIFKCNFTLPHEYGWELGDPEWSVFDVVNRVDSLETITYPSGKKVSQLVAKYSLKSGAVNINQRGVKKIPLTEEKAIFIDAPEGVTATTVFSIEGINYNRCRKLNLGEIRDPKFERAKKEHPVCAIAWPPGGEGGRMQFHDSVLMRHYDEIERHIVYKVYYNVSGSYFITEGEKAGEVKYYKNGWIDSKYVRDDYLRKPLKPRSQITEIQTGGKPIDAIDEQNSLEGRYDQFHEVTQPLSPDIKQPDTNVQPNYQLPPKQSTHPSTRPPPSGGVPTVTVEEPDFEVLDQPLPKIEIGAPRTEIQTVTPETQTPRASNPTMRTHIPTEQIERTLPQPKHTTPVIEDEVVSEGQIRAAERPNNRLSLPPPRTEANPDMSNIEITPPDLEGPPIPLPEIKSTIHSSAVPSNPTLDEIQSLTGTCLPKDRRARIPRIDAFNDFLRGYWYTKYGNRQDIEELFAIDALARTLYGEIRSCFKHGIRYPMAIARIILNRAGYSLEKYRNANGSNLSLVQSQIRPFINFTDQINQCREKDQKILSPFIAGYQPFQNTVEIAQLPLTDLIPFVVEARFDYFDERGRFRRGGGQFSTWNSNDVNLKKVLCPQKDTVWKKAVELSTSIVRDYEQFIRETQQVRYGHYTGNKYYPHWAEKKCECNVGIRRLRGVSCRDQLATCRKENEEEGRLRLVRKPIYINGLPVDNDRCITMFDDSERLNKVLTPVWGDDSVSF